MASVRDDNLVVQTISGPVVGFLSTHRLSAQSSVNAAPGDRAPLRKWLGIPYGQAGRWERPRDPDAWTQSKECFEFDSAFPQMPSPFDLLYKGKEGWPTREFLGQGEDGFSLNVFSPPGEVKDLPVIVYLYGGNFNSGSSNFPVYDPSEFVRQQSAAGQPCIVVTGDYRVGIFGWLATEDLAEVNGHPGNYGLYDCIKILDWVQKNITAFGGNPQNVTVVGESAGAYLISALLNSGRKLFKRAVLQSGSHTVMAQRPGPFFPMYDRLLDTLGVYKSSTASERVEDLKKVPWEKLLEASATLFFPGLWGLTSDPEEKGWDRHIWTKIDRGEYDPWIESAIITINKDEGTFFSDRGRFWEDKNLMLALRGRGVFSPEMFPAFQRLYPSAPLLPDKSNLPELGCTKFLHDQAILTPLHHFATSLSRQAHPVTGNALKVFVCQFECMPRTLLEGYEHLGVVHTGEIPFIFNMASLWSYNEDDQDAKTADVVGTWWAAFAQRGDPGWQRYTVEQGQAVVIGDGGEMSQINANELRPEYREFWYPLLRAQAESG